MRHSSLPYIYICIQNKKHSETQTTKNTQKKIKQIKVQTNKQTIYHAHIYMYPNQKTPRNTPHQKNPKNPKIQRILIQTNTNHQKKPSGWGRKNVHYGMNMKSEPPPNLARGRRVAKKKTQTKHNPHKNHPAKTTHNPHRKILKIPKSRES